MKANQYYAGACVVITGAGSGIGRLMALRIVEEGGRVAIWDINGEAARTTADMANAQVGADPADPKAIAFTVDVTDNAAVQRAAADTIEALGRVNVLINNAGVVSGAPFEDLTEQQIRRTFAVNVLSLFWTTKAFMPALRKQQRAAIVTVASAAGIVAVARQTDYAASKFAAVGFTSSLRSELADRIVEAVAKGRERLIMPPFAAVAGFVAALPPKFADPIYGFFGLNEGMDHFTGRK